MKYAVISDIHANLEALTAVLGAADAAGAHRIICLGDIVGYYVDPGPCIELVRSREAVSVRGNHDSVAAEICHATDFSPTAALAIQWTREQLSSEHRTWLASLPILQSVDNSFLAVHAALHPQPNEHLRINGAGAAQESFRQMTQRGFRICFFGHTHAAIAYISRNGQTSIISGDQIRLEPDSLYLINPGSVGQPRDGDRRASFLLFDGSEHTVHMIRCSYDLTAAREKAIAAGLIRRPSLIRKTAKWLCGRA